MRESDTHLAGFSGWFVRSSYQCVGLYNYLKTEYHLHGAAGDPSMTIIIMILVQG